MAEYHKLFTRKIELWLDNGYGSCILKDESIKQIIISALDYFSDIRYRLWEYTVAANHVHLLIEPIGDHQLSDIMHSLKRHTARHINKQSGKSGAFWQREYFDHIVRSEAQLFKFVQYIRNHDPGAIYEKGRRRSSKGGSSL
jgi:REP element-mobilizing transposase RayT